MSEDLIDSVELMKLLGYKDERSLRRWCKVQEIPIIHFGIKKYVSKHLLTQYIDNQLVIFETKTQALKYISDPQDSNIESKKNQRAKESYNPNNEIISKYLAKYESASKTPTAKKR